MSIKQKILKLIHHPSTTAVPFLTFAQKAANYRAKIDPQPPSLNDSRTLSRYFRDQHNFSTHLNGLIGMQILRTLQENNVQQKLAHTRKITVAFIIHSLDIFPGKSVYHAMIDHKLFKPIVVLYDFNENQLGANHQLWQNYQHNLQELRQAGYHVYPGYDEQRNFIPLETYQPDIVFVCNPNLDGFNLSLSNTYLNLHFLTCYLNYGFDVVNNYIYHYNNQPINAAWKYFVSTREDYDELLKYSVDYGLNAVLSGHTKLDDYQKPLAECHLPKKIDNHQPIIIYAPHHSIHSTWTTSNLATFHLYHQQFFQLAKNHPHYNFVYKPHPLLANTVVAQKVMSAAQYQQYLDDWRHLPNGLVVTDEYIDLFRHSDLLITDSGSFIGEWLPTKKPCLYLVNPERDQATYLDGFSPFAQKILHTYYLCHNWEELTTHFNNILVQKIDPYQDARLKVLENNFINFGHAGEFIVNYLENIFTA